MATSGGWLNGFGSLPLDPEAFRPATAGPDPSTEPLR